MAKDKLPYINIAQSAIVIPPASQIPFALDIKILPDKNIPPNPSLGYGYSIFREVWLVNGWIMRKNH